MKNKNGCHNPSYRANDVFLDEGDDDDDERVDQLIGALQEENRQLKSQQWLMAGLGLFLGFSIFGD